MKKGILAILILLAWLVATVGPAEADFGGVNVSVTDRAEHAGLTIVPEVFFAPSGGQPMISVLYTPGQPGQAHPSFPPRSEAGALIVPRAVRGMRDPSAIWLTVEAGFLDGGKPETMPHPREDPGGLPWVADQSQPNRFWLNLSKLSAGRYFVAVRYSHWGGKTTWQIVIIRASTSFVVNDEAGFVLDVIDPTMRVYPEELELARYMPGGWLSDGTGIVPDHQPLIQANPYGSATVTLQLWENKGKTAPGFVPYVQLINLASGERTAPTPVDPQTGQATFTVTPGRYQIAIGEGGWAAPNRGVVEVAGGQTLAVDAFPATATAQTTRRQVVTRIAGRWTQILVQQLRVVVRQLGLAPMLGRSAPDLATLQTLCHDHPGIVIAAVRLMGHSDQVAQAVLQAVADGRVRRMRYSQLLTELGIPFQPSSLPLESMAWTGIDFTGQSGVHVLEDVRLAITKGDPDPWVWAIQVDLAEKSLQFGIFADCSNLGRVAVRVARTTTEVVIQQGSTEFPAPAVRGLQFPGAVASGVVSSGRSEAPSTSSSGFTLIPGAPKQSVNVNIPGRSPATLRISTDAATSTSASGAGAATGGGAAGAGAGNGSGAAGSSTTVDVTF